MKNTEGREGQGKRQNSQIVRDTHEGYIFMEPGSYNMEYSTLKNSGGGKGQPIDRDDLKDTSILYIE